MIKVLWSWNHLYFEISIFVFFGNYTEPQTSDVNDISADFDQNILCETFLFSHATPNTNAVIWKD